MSDSENNMVSPAALGDVKKVELSAREQEILAKAIQCLKSPPEVNLSLVKDSFRISKSTPHFARRGIFVSKLVIYLGSFIFSSRSLFLYFPPQPGNVFSSSPVP
jgi:hypothetical protein